MATENKGVLALYTGGTLGSVCIVKVIEENHNRCEGFVIVPGIDTIADAASAIAFRLAYLGKPVIIRASHRRGAELRHKYAWKD